MRRAINQRRFAKVRVTEGRISGTFSESEPYDPFGLYERGLAPHLDFANAKDIEEWHKQYGPLFEFADPYNSSVEVFLDAQRRFVAVMSLWGAWKRDRTNIGECFVRVVKETGYVSLPGRREFMFTWEGRGWPSEQPIKGHKHDPHAKLVTVDGKPLNQAAEEFSRTTSHQKLRLAAEWTLKHALAMELEGVQPDFSNKEGFEATWIVQNFLQACYLMLFFDMTKSRGIRNCAKCGQLFYQSIKRPRHCSEDCARRNRQLRYWKRRGKTLRKTRRDEEKQRSTNTADSTQ